MTYLLKAKFFLLCAFVFSSAHALSFTDFGLIQDPMDHFSKRESVIVSLLSDFSIPSEGDSENPELRVIFDDAGYLSAVVFINRRGFMSYQGDLPGILGLPCDDYRNSRSEEYFQLSEGAMVDVGLSPFADQWDVSVSIDSRSAKGYRVPPKGSLCRIPRHLSHRYLQNAR